MQIIIRLYFFGVLFLILLHALKYKMKNIIIISSVSNVSVVITSAGGMV
jgi:hypothetical protein